jgi:hypothetical protein
LDLFTAETQSTQRYFVFCFQLRGLKAKGNLPFVHQSLDSIGPSYQGWEHLVGYLDIFKEYLPKAMGFYVFRRLSGKHKHKILSDLCVSAVNIFFQNWAALLD